MKKYLVILLIFFGIINVKGQTLETVEKRMDYKDGYEIVNILKNDVTISYNDELVYFWYDESSGVNNSKGGSGGRLLHGRSRQVINGVLRLEGNYNLGLKDGETKEWDSLGEITIISKYSKGICTYVKERNEDGGFKETIGEFYSKGRVDKYYKKYQKTPYCKIEYTDGIFGFHDIVTYYYEGSNQIYMTYESYVFGDLVTKTGFYKSYYSNGKPLEIGQYKKGIRIDEWKYYPDTKSLTYVIHKYKTYEENWENGKTKVQGSLLLINDIWEKDGDWWYFTNDGVRKENKLFVSGVEQIPN